MKNPLVSVVMPAYNAEKYIEAALQSVLSQSFRDFELIVVDDCSKDNTWSILSEYAKNDDRLVIHRLETNSGSAKYPRDLAVQKSRADLICWIDSDDIVELDYLMKLYERQKETTADIVCSQMYAFRGGDINNVSFVKPKERINGKMVITGEEAMLKTVLGKEWTLNANGCLVKKNLWTSTSTYLDGKSFWMDVDDVAIREMLLSANYVAFIDAKYYYRIHDLSITKKVSPKLFETLITAQCVVQMIEKKFGTKSYQYQQVKNQYVRRVLSYIRLYVINLKVLNLDAATTVRELIKKHYDSCSLLDVLHSDLNNGQKIVMMLPFSLSLKIIKLINR